MPCDTVTQIIGPTIWTDVTGLKAARVIQLQLSGGAIAGYGAGLLCWPA